MVHLVKYTKNQKSHLHLVNKTNFPLEFDLRTSHEQASYSEHYWSGKLPFAVEIFSTSVGFSHFACDVETSIILTISPVSFYPSFVLESVTYQKYYPVEW